MNITEAKRILKENGFDLAKDDTFVEGLENLPWAKDYDQVIPVNFANDYGTDIVFQYYIVSRRGKYNVVKLNVNEKPPRPRLASKVWFDDITVKNIDRTKETCIFNVTFGPAHLYMYGSGNIFDNCDNYGLPDSARELVFLLNNVSGYGIDINDIK